MQKAFGAVDRVEGPESRTEAWTAIADPGHDLFDSGLPDDLTNDLRNLPGEIRIVAQRPGVFLGDQGIVWKGISEPRGDYGLNGEVGNRDR